MIRLDKQTNQKEQILELIQNSLENSNLELECLFNNSPNKYKPNITHQNFISILKRFSKNPDFEEKTNVSLNIFFGSKSKYKDVRISIKSPGAIKMFCNNENLSTIRNNVSFETKQFIKGNLNRVNLPNYNIKFNLKSERNFNNDEAKIKSILTDWGTELKQYRYKKTFSFTKKSGDFTIDVSIVRSSMNDDKYITVEEVIQNELINNVVKPNNVKLSFTEWWTQISTQPNEKILVRNIDNLFTNISESNIFNTIPTYEVEIEYIRNKITEKPKFKTITERKAYLDTEFSNYFKLIGSVLQCIQGSFFILSNDDKYEVKKNIINVVESSITETALAKQESSKVMSGGFDEEDTDKFTEEHYQEEESNEQGSTEIPGFEDHEKEESDIPTTEKERHDKVQSGGSTSAIKELRKTIRQNLEKGGVFFGPNIVDLTHSKITTIDPKAIPNPKYNTNIQINYAVTDKTDGDRHLLFIDKNGKTYGIDRINTIKYMGCTLPQLANSIFDGEFVNRNESGKLMNHYYIFDCYIYKGENVMIKPFHCNSNTGRHYYISLFAKYIQSGTDIIQDNPKMSLLIFKKEYLLGNTYKSFTQLESNEKPLIFEQCSRLLNKMNKDYGGFVEVGHLYPYKTDGLVFLPDNLSIYQNHEGQYISNTFKQETWNLNYKWKPADHLTIDFKVQFQKDLDSKTIRYTYFNNKKYIVVNLISRLFKNSRFKHQLDYWLINCGLTLDNLPEDMNFFAINPFIGNFDNEGDMTDYMGVAMLPVDGNDNIICHNNDIVVDGQIVEFAYDTTVQEEQFRWTPTRVRADKTIPNALFGTALGAWELINNPITKEFLSGSHFDIEDQLNDDLRTVTYYTADTYGETDKYITTPLNKFNNFVKSYLINRVLSGYIKPKVLDLACGRIGEMFKYIAAGVSTCIAMDINTDNIYNEKDGAAARIMNNKFTMPEVNKFADNTILLVGDVSKNISSGEAVSDPLNKYFLDVIYGRAKGRTPKLKKMEGAALDQFDMVACMYAIHYMLDDDDKLDNFLQNVSENLLDQGYFIGVCLDGKTVLKEMQGLDEFIAKVNDKVIYSIRKHDDVKYDKLTTGNKITTFYETFAGHFTENLVNMKYIAEKAVEHNLKLIEYKNFLEEPISLLTQYEKEKSHFVKKIRETPELMTWARMNYYFIFQKMRDVQ